MELKSGADDQPARLTDDRFAEIRAREQATTRGPWEHHTYQRVWNTEGLEALKDSPTLADSVSTEHSVVTSWIHGQVQDKVAIFGIGVSWCFETPYAIHVRPEDAEFVAHARSDVPYLLDRVERAEAALAELRRACHLEMPEGERLSVSGYVCALCLWDADPDDPATHEPTCPLFEAGDAEGEDR